MDFCTLLTGLWPPHSRRRCRSSQDDGQASTAWQAGVPYSRLSKADIARAHMAQPKAPCCCVLGGRVPAVHGPFRLIV